MIASILFKTVLLRLKMLSPPHPAPPPSIHPPRRRLRRAYLLVWGVAVLGRLWLQWCPWTARGRVSGPPSWRQVAVKPS